MCLTPISNLMSFHSKAPWSQVSPSTSPTKENISITPSTPVLFKQDRSQVHPGRVSFSKAEVVGTVTHRSVISREDHQKIWYLAHEQESFRTEVRTLCQKIRDDGLASDNTAATTTHNSAEFPTRGLEQRICKNRQRNKALAIWGTLKAQQRNNDPEFIAMIARKCSLTATQLAYMEAARDYCEIYNPEAIASLSAEIESFASKSFPIRLKRKSPDSTSVATNEGCGTNTNGRNVRIRIT